MKVVVDRIGPKIVMDSPAEGMRTKDAAIKVSGSVMDTHGLPDEALITLEVGNEKRDFKLEPSGKFETTITLPAGEIDETVMVSCSVVDRVGNASDMTHSVHVDRKKPMIRSQ